MCKHLLITINKLIMYFKKIIFILLVIAISIRAFSQKDTLPLPNATKSVANYSNVTGWKDGNKPIAPQGFTVSQYATGFQNPRWMYVAPNGDVLVAESNSNFTLIEKAGAIIKGVNKSDDLAHSADRITILRDTNKDGIRDIAW